MPSEWTSGRGGEASASPAASAPPATTALSLAACGAAANSEPRRGVTRAAMIRENLLRIPPPTPRPPLPLAVLVALEIGAAPPSEGRGGRDSDECMLTVGCGVLSRGEVGDDAEAAPPE